MINKTTPNYNMNTDSGIIFYLEITNQLNTQQYIKDHII